MYRIRDFSCALHRSQTWLAVGLLLSWECTCMAVTAPAAIRADCRAVTQSETSLQCGGEGMGRRRGVGRERRTQPHASVSPAVCPRGTDHCAYCIDPQQWTNVRLHLHVRPTTLVVATYDCCVSPTVKPASSRQRRCDWAFVRHRAHHHRTFHGFNQHLHRPVG